MSTVTIQKTAKKWKTLRLIGGVVSCLSLFVGAVVALTVGLGAGIWAWLVLVLIGLGINTVARVAVWWHHS